MKNNNYTIPNGFDPYSAVRAIKGVSYFLHDYYAEGPGVFRTLPDGHYANILGLVWIHERVACELHDYFGALDEAGVKLPTSDEDFEELETGNCVRETPPRYATSSR